MTGPSRKKTFSNCHSWKTHSIIEQCRLEGTSACYLVLPLAQIMANFKVRLGCSGRSPVEFWKPLWMENPEPLWAATLTMIFFFFLKCLIRISLAALFNHCPMSFHCAFLKKSMAPPSLQSPLDSRRNHLFQVTLWIFFWKICCYSIQKCLMESHDVQAFTTRFLTHIYQSFLRNASS